MAEVFHLSEAQTFAFNEVSNIIIGQLLEDANKLAIPNTITFPKANSLYRLKDQTEKTALIGFIYNKYGIKFSYEELGERNKPDIKFTAREFDFETTSTMGLKIISYTLKLIALFIESHFRKQNKAVIDVNQKYQLPAYFLEVLNVIIGTIGYHSTLKSIGNEQYEFKFEKKTAPENTLGKLYENCSAVNNPNINDNIAMLLSSLERIKKTLDQKQEKKEQSESVQSEFSEKAIEQLQQSDAGVVIVSSDMVNDEGFPALMAAIKRLQKDEEKPKIITVLIVDHISGDLDIQGDSPKSIGVLGTESRRTMEQNEIFASTQISRMKTIKGSIFKPNTTVAIIAHTPQDLKLNLMKTRIPYLPYRSENSIRLIDLNGNTLTNDDLR